MFIEIIWNCSTHDRLSTNNNQNKKQRISLTIQRTNVKRRTKRWHWTDFWISSRRERYMAYIFVHTMYLQLLFYFIFCCWCWFLFTNRKKSYILSIQIINFVLCFYRHFDRKSDLLREQFDTRCINKLRPVFNRVLIWDKL